MSAAQSVPSDAIPPSSPDKGAGEQRFIMYGVPWKTYALLREALDEPGLRMTYYKGTLELMSPSAEHERIKKMIARMIETFATETEAPLYAYGSTTFRREMKERGLEPDECYCVGADLAQYPDIAVEVVISSGGIEKLPVYEGLGVREVWFWRDDRKGFELYALGEGGYTVIARSRLVPGLEFELLTRFATRVDQPQAIKEYVAILRTPR